MPTIWTPTYQILDNQSGNDITALIRERLFELAITEEAQDRSDQLTLRLDDREIDGAVFEFPNPNARIWVLLGYKESHLNTQGLYRVDEVRHGGPPDTVEIKASAAALTQPLRAPTTRSWHKETLGSVAEAIAADHGLEARIAPQVAGETIPHADQKAESDIAFLTRIAGLFDAVARPVGPDLLVVLPKGKQIQASGASAPEFAIRRNEIVEWRYSHPMRRPSGEAKGDSAQGGVKAYYWDHDANEHKTVFVGEPPYEEIKHLRPTKLDAIADAKKEHQGNDREQDTLTINLPGRPDLQTEAALVLDGEQWHPKIPKRWRITRLRHQLRDGLTTQIDAERMP